MKYDDMDVFPESLICKRWTKTAKNDHISSFASQEGGGEKMLMFRRTALAAAFSSLSDVSCKSANDYKEALEGIRSLCDKLNPRHEGNGNGKHKANESAAGDPKVHLERNSRKRNVILIAEDLVTQYGSVRHLLELMS